MRKQLVTISILLIIILVSFTANAESQIAINVDGNTVQYNETYGYPFIDENGRTQVPLRKTMEEYGCAVEWDNDNQQAVLNLNDVEIKVPIGEKHIVVNGFIQQTDTSAQIRNGRTFLPIRPVVEALEGVVSWDSEKHTVSINRGKNEGFLITDVDINSKGELIITTEVGDEINLGRVKGRDGDDGRNGTDGKDGSPYSTFAEYNEGTKFYNLFPQGEFEFYVLHDNDRYSVTVTDSYYELMSINDFDDDSAWDLKEGPLGLDMYFYRPFDVKLSMDAHTDLALAGKEIVIAYSSETGLAQTIRGSVQSDGSININNEYHGDWVIPKVMYFNYSYVHDSSDSDYNLDDLEDQLFDDYDDIEGIDIEDIVLNGDEDDIEVGIYIDLTQASDYNYWVDNVSDAEVEDFLQDIVDDILDEFPDADITGFIEDDYDGSKLVEFGIDISGNVNFGGGSSPSGNIEDLEDQLKVDYDEIDGVDVAEINLVGDEDDIEVAIYIDTTSSSQWDAWTELRDADIEDFLQDIVDDILDEFPYADITGFIEDEYDNSTMVEFEIDSSGNVNFGGGSSSSGDLGDLEDQLIDDYDNIEGIDIEDIVLDGDEDDIEVEIYIDLTQTSDFDYWVDNVSDSEIEDFLQDIVDDILDEFPDADITGFIEDEYDNEIIIDFDIDSSGNVDFSRDL